MSGNRYKQSKRSARARRRSDQSEDRFRQSRTEKETSYQRAIHDAAENGQPVPRDPEGKISVALDMGAVVYDDGTQDSWVELPPPPGVLPGYRRFVVIRGGKPEDMEEATKITPDKILRVAYRPRADMRAAVRIERPNLEVEETDMEAIDKGLFLLQIIPPCGRWIIKDRDDEENRKVIDMIRIGEKELVEVPWMYRLAGPWVKIESRET